MMNPGPATAESFGHFVEEYYQAAHRFALSLCRHEADACDLTQQVFCIAQSKFHQVRDGSKRKSWLFTILAREFKRGCRQRSRHSHHSLESVEDELPLVTVDHSARIDARGLWHALLGLEEHFRLPLRLFYLEQFSYKEIAELVGVPIGTVMSRLARGKELLRERVEPSRRRVTSEEQVAIPVTLATGTVALQFCWPTPNFCQRANETATWENLASPV